MKQRFVLNREADTEKLIVQEYVEQDSDRYLLACKETYEVEALKEAAAADMLIEALRTRNLFPFRELAEKLAESVAVLLESDEEMTEFVYDEMDAISQEDLQFSEDAEDEEDEENIALDNLLEDDGASETYDEHEEINDIGGNLPGISTTGKDKTGTIDEDVDNA
ncbi:MAG: hypothetical protein CSA22_03940 [Deltaproteobacteria bacterium]|nr:MAG: hypothetical protein CSA22_03940 [Deltaproteobacteria bacterium]